MRASWLIFGVAFAGGCFGSCTDPQAGTDPLAVCGDNSAGDCRGWGLNSVFETCEEGTGRVCICTSLCNNMIQDGSVWCCWRPDLSVLPDLWARRDLRGADLRGADLTGQPGTLTCSELVQCQNMCTSSACRSNCLVLGTPTAQALNETLDACITAVCVDGDSDASTGRCPDSTIPGDCDRCVSNAQHGTDDSVPSAKNGICKPPDDAACGRCVKELIDCANDV